MPISDRVRLISSTLSSLTFSELQSLKEEIASTQKSQRPLGIWKGKVEISDNFHKTSNDIISEFGIEE
ncbi:hypothetical protein [Nostoc sp. NMS4]|uniref:hypothetical protein n=1 Tax=Nostoc sp. NMS4 TaxID=2815390 RepID=UPI0025E4B393|nr:hypothetical protein [Nostoc sp. NMS4]MBN3923857.1 hypothetical protein [Nostoc sp. NMS4]